jgi:hypothetical protein
MIPSQDFKEFLKHEQRNWRDEGDKGDKQRDEQKDWINERSKCTNLPVCPGHIGDKRAFEEGAKAELNHIIQILCGSDAAASEFRERLQKTLTNAYIEIINGIINFSYSNNDIKTLTEILDELKRIRTKFEITR